MDICKEIKNINFDTFSDITDATRRLILSAKSHGIIIKDREYAVYEQHLFSLGKFDEQHADLIKDLLRGQFYQMQQQYSFDKKAKKEETEQKTISKPAHKESIEIDENTITDIKDWVKLGVLTEEEANIKNIETPDWMKAMEEDAKRFKKDVK